MPIRRLPPPPPPPPAPPPPPPRRTPRGGGGGGQGGGRWGGGGQMPIRRPPHPDRLRRSDLSPQAGRGDRGRGYPSHTERVAPLLDHFRNALGDLLDARADGLHVGGRLRVAERLHLRPHRLVEVVDPDLRGLGRQQ